MAFKEVVPPEAGEVTREEAIWELAAFRAELLEHDGGRESKVTRSLALALGDMRKRALGDRRKRGETVSLPGGRTGGLSRRAYARHRHDKGLVGGSLKAVQRALDQQRIHLEADGTIDPLRADREWAENTDYRKAPASVTEHPGRRRVP